MALYLTIDLVIYLKISGSEIINNLPNKNVLFVSNHKIILLME